MVREGVGIDDLSLEAPLRIGWRLRMPEIQARNYKCEFISDTVL